MKYFSVFTGAGGFEQAMPSDWECVGHSEIDKWANAVLRYHYPNVINYGDITRIEWGQIPDFDLLVGGSPCQDLSLAGKRKGIEGQRSGLFFEYVKALKGKKPSYFIWENVKGALSSNQGWDFAEVLNQLSESGYSLWWQVLNAKDFGVPQNRERIFITGFRDRSPPEVFFEQESNQVSSETFGTLSTEQAHSYGRHSSKKLIEITKEQSQGNRIYSTEGISTTIASQAGGRGAKTGLYQILNMHRRNGDSSKGGTGLRASHNHSFALETTPHYVAPVLTPDRANKRQNGRRMKDNGEPMFTLTGQDQHGIAIDSDIRRLVPKECERLMSWQDDWTKYGIDEKGNKIEISDTQRYKLCGNGVVSNVVRELIRVMMDKN